MWLATWTSTKRWSLTFRNASPSEFPTFVVASACTLTLLCSPHQVSDDLILLVTATIDLFSLCESASFTNRLIGINSIGMFSLCVTPSFSFNFLLHHTSPFDRMSMDSLLLVYSIEIHKYQVFCSSQYIVTRAPRVLTSFSLVRFIVCTRFAFAC